MTFLDAPESLERSFLSRIAEMLGPEKPPDESPLTFREYVDKARPGYVWHDHCKRLAAVLQDVADGKRKRVMVFMPPRHGKSELVSRLFSGYFLFRYPHRWVGLTSYGADLAYDLSRMAKTHYLEAGGELSGGAVKQWLTGKGGGLWAAGVGGPITGKGFHLGIVDDSLKDAEEAESDLIRKKQKSWWDSTFKTRRQRWTPTDPHAAIINVQCMAGDTSVLMATGDEKPLRDIRPGDRVATYEDGKVSTSRVRNWINNGPDVIYEIRMKSGIIAKANARHPFLVEEGGETKWKRTASLKKGSVILRVTGRASRAPGRDAASQSDAKACACRTTISTDGGPGTDRPRSIPGLAAKHICDAATGLTSRNMTAFWPSRAVFAPSASSPLPQGTPEPIGTASSASTIATTAKGSGGFSVTTATLPSDTERPWKPSSPPLSTYEVTRDTVVEVVEAGIEDVFDVEIERTENFIANGLVSHNTRWHEDDLGGWLLDGEEGALIPHRWHIVSMAAIKEAEPTKIPSTCTLESDPREPGEPLCPSIETLDSLRQSQGENQYYFSAQFQQRPTPPGGLMFTSFPVVDAIPEGAHQWVRYWDKAGTTGGGDWSVGLLMCRTAAGEYVIIDVVRGQWAASERDKVIRDTASADGLHVHQWFEQEPGSGGKESAETSVKMLAGHIAHKETVTGTKETRAKPLASQSQVGNVKLLRSDTWNRAFLDEARLFPHGRHDDQIDAASGAFNKLTLVPRPATGVARPHISAPSVPQTSGSFTKGIPDGLRRWGF